MQHALSNSEWDEVSVRTAGGQAVTYVYRRGPGKVRYEPWVVVAPSAIMARLGKRGKGLYAARGFRRDEYIGKYDGQVVGHYASREAALGSSAAQRRARRGVDKLITLRPPRGGGVDLVDGTHGGAPYISLCNDGRGTALQPNCDITDAGWLRVLHARVPRFDTSSSLDANIHSELRVDYSSDYWALFDVLGTECCPVEVD